MADDSVAGCRRRRRSRPRLPRAARPRRLDRPDRARRQPLEDDRGAGRARRRAAGGRSSLERHLARTTPANRAARRREIVQPGHARGAGRAGQASRTRGHDGARGRRAATAWSDIALTDGYHGRTRRPQRGRARRRRAALRPQPRRRRPGLGRLGGTHLHTLNPALDEMGLALRNMGGYDAQTIAGVISTSTHGSGLAFGPFPDAVRSLELVVAGGRGAAVEPADGPTDPAAFAEESLELVQDDEPVRRGDLRPRDDRPAPPGDDRSPREVLAERGAHARAPGRRSARPSPRTAFSARAATTSCSSIPTPATTASTGCW